MLIRTSRHNVFFIPYISMISGMIRYLHPDEKAVLNSGSSVNYPDMDPQSRKFNHNEF
jgi:hypothetical protein